MFKKHLILIIALLITFLSNIIRDAVDEILREAKRGATRAELSGSWRPPSSKINARLFNNTLAQVLQSNNRRLRKKWANMEQKIVHEFSRLRVLGKAAAATSSDPPSPSKKKQIVNCKKMDALVHELNAALELDEANNSSANAESGGSGGSGPASSNRRRVWRRRCKSTSNLTCLNSGTSKSSDLLKNSQNHSEDSSSSSDDTRAVILTNDRGTSSLQLTDSDEETVLLSPRSLVHSTKRKNVSFQHQQQQQPQQQLQQQQQQQQQPQQVGQQQQQQQKLMNVDTDSVNENFSPVRPSTKRKRKFKRMALDPDNSNMESGQKSKTGTIKRKKVRSRSACESSNSVVVKSTSKGSSSKNQSGPQCGQRQRQLSANVVPGKRKRSSREKSVEPDLILHSSQSAVPSHAMISEEVNCFYILWIEYHSYSLEWSEILL